jgi:hypothetical protein
VDQSLRLLGRQIQPHWIFSCGVMWRILSAGLRSTTFNT